MKRVLIGSIILISSIIIVGLVFWSGLKSNMEEVLDMEINEIVIPADGVYMGEFYHLDQIGVAVEVLIENGRIKDITYHNHIAGKGEAAEVIKEDILNKQSILVDDISGVTTSSRIIKLAIMDALNQEEIK